jgi:hypothetical protein
MERAAVVRVGFSLPVVGWFDRPAAPGAARHWSDERPPVAHQLAVSFNSGRRGSISS